MDKLTKILVCIFPLNIYTFIDVRPLYAAAENIVSENRRTRQ